jgi:hypothetical protein
MEDVNIFRALKHYWIAFILIIIVIFSAAMLVYLKQPQSYFGSISTTVQTTRIYANTSQYVIQSDNSSAWSNIIIATTQSWLSDPTYVQDILSDAKTSSSDQSLKGLSSIFNIVYSNPNSSTYQIQFTGNSKTQTNDVLISARNFLNKLRNQYNKTNGNGIQFSFIFSEPIVVSQSSSIPLTPVAGLLVGIIFALVVVVFLDYRKK